MDVLLRRGDITTRRDAVALGIIEATRKPSGAAAAVDRVTRGAISTFLALGHFRGRFLESATLFPAGGPIPRVILVGLGTAKALTPHRVRLVSARAARLARELGAGTLGTVVHGAGEGGLDPALAAQAVAEGSVLGHYKHIAYKTAAPSARPRRIEIVEKDAARAKEWKNAAVRGAEWAEAVCLARDLARTSGDDLPPRRLAERAVEIARGAGAKAQIFDTAAMERLGMGAVLAVGRGSVHQPCFVALDRPSPARGAPTIVLIGKGVTFDTGGISLKPRDNMNKMKYDMSGAAAVLGTFSALPTLEPRFRVVGLIPCAENMPGGRAFKPGDVIRALDGTTIEVTNTDAEGRLLLADALAYARRYQPDVVIDLATLTGAISVALGPYAAGLFSDDHALSASLQAAGERSGERLWRMPVWDEYLTEMRGDTADLVNSTGARDGGASLAAGFLKHFARGMRWAHLDIASTAWSPVDRPHEPRGPTGFGVRLLLEWLSSWTAASPAARPSARRTSSPRASRAAGRARR